MKSIAFGALFALALPQAAHATGGLACSTVGPKPVKISLGFGHVPSAGLFLARLRDDGTDVPVRATQWWMRGSELRLALVSTSETEEEAILIAMWNEETHSYDGSLLRARKRRWVRCREA
tara:strand:- start:50 stop:409 length:360 start_codon:yes stop_codon:yes gene_type:complete